NTGFSELDRTFGDPATSPTQLILNPYYGLSASAAGNINIATTAWSGNTDGSLLVDQVLSRGGDVTLTATGRVLDNEPLETIDSRTYDELLNYWNSLDLLTDKGTANIAAYDKSQTEAYDQYWRIRQGQPDHGAVYDPNYSVTVVPGTPLYAALSQSFTSALLVANPNLSPNDLATAVAQKIADYEQTETDEYHTLNAAVGSLTTTYDSGYQFVASTDQQTSLKQGAVWTTRELAFSLSPGALKTITATNPVVKAPNVSGRNVTINAGLGVGETVGEGTATVGVSIAANLDPKDLTDSQKIALATAERSDIVLEVKIGGVTTEVPLGATSLTPTQQAALDAAANGSVPDADLTIVVLSKRPLNFNAPTSLNVTVTAATDPAAPDQGDAFLASRGDATLGTIDVPGETRIKVVGSILNAAASAVTTGNLILEAAQGRIGTAGTPLSLDLHSGATLTARAEQGVNIG